MKKIIRLSLVSLVGLGSFGCTEKEDLLTGDLLAICVNGKIIDYNCGRNPVVQVLTPGIIIGAKVPIGDGTKKVENVVRLNNLPPEFNQLGKTFYFTLRLAKEAEKDTGPCLAIYVPYNVPQMMVKNVSELPCPDDSDDWDDWD